MKVTTQLDWCPCCGDSDITQKLQGLKSYGYTTLDLPVVCNSCEAEWSVLLEATSYTIDVTPFTKEGDI